MNFGEAIASLKEGKMLTRKGWNGKGMFIYMAIGNTVAKDYIPKFTSLPETVKSFLQQKGEDVVFKPSITMYTAAGEMQPGWLASQADMLAEDWEVAA